MHEIHLVLQIVGKIESLAKARGSKRVTFITLRYNPIQSHNIAHVQFCFDIVKKNVPLVKDALLKLNRVEPLVHCQKCAHKFEAYQLETPCPQCGGTELKPRHPLDLSLEGFDSEE